MDPPHDGLIDAVKNLLDGDVAGDDGEVEILEPTPRRNGKRAAPKDDEDDVTALRAKLRKLEEEHKKVKSENAFLKSLPSISGTVQTRDLEIDFGKSGDKTIVQSEAFLVDGIEISLSIGSNESNDHYGSEPPKAIVTPLLKKVADDGPRFVLAMIGVSQRSRYGTYSERDTTYSSSAVKMVLDKPMEYVGDYSKFQPTTELRRSRISIRLTVVVQKLENPGEFEADTKVSIVRENRHFSVSAAYLSQWSRYFRAYFAADMKEKKTGVYPIKDNDISADDFAEMLLVIHPTQKPITEDNYLTLLRLANRFEMPDLTRRVECFLIDFSSHSIGKDRVFLLATDEFNLSLVQATLLHRWRDSELLKDELISTHVYKKLQP
ncbi:hypothetical protein PENTCL1PPCAC_752, partial [Pristionchus entomophagus]